MKSVKRPKGLTKCAEDKTKNGIGADAPRVRKNPGGFILKDRLAVEEDDDCAAHADTMPKTSE